MEKHKKLIIILSIICIVITIACILIIISLKKTNNVTNNITKNETNKSYVQEVTNLKTAYNVQKYINEMIDEFYNTEEYKYEESLILSDDLKNSLKLEEGPKKFYVERVYEAKLEDNISVYFAKGFIANYKAEEIKKDNISLCYINDSEYNTGRLYLYGKVYKDIFNYNEDISKTEILKTTGLKIKKTDSGVKSLDEAIMEEKSIYKDKDLNKEVKESEIVGWYLENYKLKKAIENHEKLSTSIAFRYEGSFSDGYTVIDKDKKEYFIKPDKIPMDYQIKEKNINN